MIRMKNDSSRNKEHDPHVTSSCSPSLSVCHQCTTNSFILLVWILWLRHELNCYICMFASSPTSSRFRGESVRSWYLGSIWIAEGIGAHYQRIRGGILWWQWWLWCSQHTRSFRLCVQQPSEEESAHLVWCQALASSVVFLSGWQIHGEGTQDNSNWSSWRINLGGQEAQRKLLSRHINKNMHIWAYTDPWTYKHARAHVNTHVHI